MNKNRNIQPAVRWINNSLLNKKTIKDNLTSKIMATDPHYIGSWFYKNISGDYTHYFNEIELNALSAIKKEVQESLNNKETEYVKISVLVKKYIIPFMVDLLETGDFKDESTNFSTVMSRHNNKKNRGALPLAIEQAKKKISKIKL
jgi:hypothetical protein